jgi:DNA-binding NtrC family response regulator
MKDAYILLVEDDPLTRLALGAWLKKGGATVTEAFSAYEADAALDRGSFDLILSDVHLAGNARLEWTERVLQREACPPLVLLTGNPEIGSALRAANLPVAGYLVKPPDYALLAELIRRELAGQRQRRELLALAGAITHLLPPVPGESESDSALRRNLAELSRLLTEVTRPGRRGGAGGDAGEIWRSAITETIGILEKTKHSFRSRELGELRGRLQKILTTS